MLIMCIRLMAFLFICLPLPFCMSLSFFMVMWQMIRSTSVFSAYFGPVQSVQSISVHLSSLQSILVQIGPFGPLWSIRFTSQAPKNLHNKFLHNPLKKKKEKKKQKSLNILKYSLIKKLKRIDFNCEKEVNFQGRNYLGAKGVSPPQPLKKMYFWL